MQKDVRPTIIQDIPIEVAKHCISFLNGYFNNDLFLKYQKYLRKLKNDPFFNVELNGSVAIPERNSLLKASDMCANIIFKWGMNPN